MWCGKWMKKFTSTPSSCSHKGSDWFMFLTKPKLIFIHFPNHKIKWRGRAFRISKILPIWCWHNLQYNCIILRYCNLIQILYFNSKERGLEICFTTNAWNCVEINWMGHGHSSKELLTHNTWKYIRYQNILQISSFINVN